MDGEMNLLLIVFFGLMILKGIEGYQKGMVKKVVSLISLIIISAVIVLVAAGVTSYTEGKVGNVILAVIFLAAIGIAHHLLDLLVFSAKAISNLPVIHWIDKVLGIVVGILETVLILWTVYTFCMLMDLGVIGSMIMEWTGESPILIWFYERNYLAHYIEEIGPKISFLSLPFLEKFGTK